MTFVGIDPGNKGAITILLDGGPIIYKMPEEHNRENLCDIMREIGLIPGDKKVVIEKQIIMPMSGKKPCPRCRALIPYMYNQKGIATTFRNYGVLLGMMMLLQIPFEEVDGTIWKKYFKLSKLGKEGSIKLAKQLFPSLSLEIGEDDNKAESILLAEYGRRVC